MNLRGIVITLIVGCISVHIVHAAPPEPLDVVLALDNSGSMRVNDPQRLMTKAVASFVAQLPVNSQAGLLVFDSSVRMLLDLTPTADASFSARLAAALMAVDYKGSKTDIPGAVERSTYEIRSKGRQGSRRAIILFTDGIIDLGDAAKDSARRNWLHTRLTQEAVQEHIGVFGIAFTGDADFQLMQSLSRDTGASYFRIQNPSEISPAFGQIASMLTPRPALVVQATPTASSLPSLRAMAGAGIILLTLAGIGLWINSHRRSAVPLRATLTRVASIPEVFAINRRVIKIGRLARVRFRQNDLVIDDPRVSKRHAEIRYSRRQFYIRDNSSRNGTFVSRDDGTLVRVKPGKKTSLPRGSRVVFHGHEYIFDCVEPRQLTQAPGDETEMALPMVRDKCHVCRLEFDQDTLRTWHRFKVCPACRNEIDQLSTAEASALERQVESELREALTQRF
jgi:hypothetical protein